MLWFSPLKGHIFPHPPQGTVNGGAASKWPRCRWDIKHNRRTTFFLRKGVASKVGFHCTCNFKLWTDVTTNVSVFLKALDTGAGKMNTSKGIYILQTNINFRQEHLTDFLWFVLMECWDVVERHKLLWLWVSHSMTYDTKQQQPYVDYLVGNDWKDREVHTKRFLYLATSNTSLIGYWFLWWNMFYWNTMIFLKSKRQNHMHCKRLRHTWL